jgi:hypothetical protein
MVTKRVSVERAEIRGSGTSGDSDAAQRSAAPGLIGTSGEPVGGTGRNLVRDHIVWGRSRSSSVP